MGCRLSKSNEDGANDVVWVCGERKRLAKAAVEKRKAFAQAHCNYVASLSAVSSAIGVFVARFSSSSTLPQLGLPTHQNRVSLDSHDEEALVQATTDYWSVGSESSDDDDDGGKEGEVSSRHVCEHFYDDDEPLISGRGEIGWDFFNLLDNPPPPPPSTKAVSKKKEKLGVKKRQIGKKETQILGVKGRSSNEMGGNGRELLVALKDLERHFARASDSGLLVSRMLEVNMPVMEEFREKSSKCSKANTWNRSPSQSSSSKSLISWSSKSSSTCADSRTDLFDGSGGMESGSHSSTLGRLYAWEKKLYDEVKAAEQTMKAYQQKCSQMKKPQRVGKDKFSPSKETAEVTYLYNRILVARRSVESISKQIEKLRDEELQPQLVELLHGLMRSWKIMCESHETQNKIISGVKSFTSQINEKLCHESHRLATLQLEKELRNWQSCFLNYISTQKSYVMCLCGWLSKLTDSDLILGPALLVACQNWLTSLEKLPDKAVKFSLKALVKDVHDLWVQQGEEQEAKKKVDGLVKEIDRKAIVRVKREEGKILLLKPSVQKFLVRNSAEDFTGKKNMMDLLRMRVESEKVKYQSSVERTEAATLNGLKMGFSSVFESLTDFSRASVKLYAGVVTIL